MWEPIYLFVVAATCGLVGGYISRAVALCNLNERNATRNNINSTHIWVYSTGGKGSATNADVWRKIGFDPEKEATETVLGGLAIAAIAAGVAGFGFPPPFLAKGPPIPWLTWANVVIPLVTFLAAFPLGVFLGTVARDFSEIVRLALGTPGVVLVAILGLSYLWPLPGWLVLLFLAAMGLFVAAPIVVWTMERRRSYRHSGEAWGLLGIATGSNGLLWAVVAAGLLTPVFSPLDSLMRTYPPAPGIPGPGGAPPLRLVDFEPPMELITAQRVLHEASSAGSTAETQSVWLRDAAHQDLLLGLTSEPSSGGGQGGDVPEQIEFVVGGMSPRDPSARRPLTLEEADLLIRLLGDAVDGASGGATGAAALSSQADRSGADPETAPAPSSEPGPTGRDVEVAVAGRMFARLHGLTRSPPEGDPARPGGSGPRLPLADRDEVVRRAAARFEQDYEEIEESFREGWSTESMSLADRWVLIAPAIQRRVFEDRPTLTQFPGWLRKNLGEPLADVPAEAGGRLDWPWPDPAPGPEHVWRYGLVSRTGGYNRPLRHERVLEIDLRRPLPLSYRVRTFDLDGPVAGSGGPSDGAGDPMASGAMHGSYAPGPPLPVFGGQAETSGYSARDPERPASHPMERRAAPPEAVSRPDDVSAGPGPGGGGLVGSSVIPAERGRPRTWMSADGKFRVEATLLSADATAVELRRADDRVIHVPRDRLSEADQRYVADVEASR